MCGAARSCSLFSRADCILKGGSTVQMLILCLSFPRTPTPSFQGGCLWFQDLTAVASGSVTSSLMPLAIAATFFTSIQVLRSTALVVQKQM